MESGWNVWVWLVGVGTTVVARMCAKFKVWMTIVEWVECMGVASVCGEQEVGVANESGWNLWVWLLGVVVRMYIDILILLIPTPLASVLFYSSIPTFCSF